MCCGALRVATLPVTSLCTFAVPHEWQLLHILYVPSFSHVVAALLVPCLCLLEVPYGWQLLHVSYELWFGCGALRVATHFAPCPCAFEVP